MTHVEMAHHVTRHPEVKVAQEYRRAYARIDSKLSKRVNPTLSFSKLSMLTYMPKCKQFLLSKVANCFSDDEFTAFIEEKLK